MNDFLIRRMVVFLVALAPLAMGGCPRSDLLSAILGVDEVFAPPQPPAPRIRSNSPPIIEAGDDQSARAGDFVVLDGTATFDSDGDQLLYLWRQTDGEPLVEIDGLFSSVATFDVPSDLAAATTLTFRLTVIDGRVAVIDDVRITLEP